MIYCNYLIKIGKYLRQCVCVCGDIIDNSLRSIINWYIVFHVLNFSSLHIWQTFNALFIIRCTIKYLIEIGSEYQLLQQFEAIATESALSSDADASVAATCIDIVDKPKTQLTCNVDGSKFESFFNAVVNLLVIVPVK